jgi:hypothetical protein
MRDWIVGLQRAAMEMRAGVGAAEWESASRTLGGDIPEDLRDLYAHINGARFASGVVLFPLESTATAEGAWHFGRRDQEQLMAVRKRDLDAVELDSPPPEWVEALDDDGWVYVARDDGANRVRLYRSLEQILTARIPPAQSEEKGDTPFVRALTVVDTALAELGGSPGNGAVKDVLSTVRRAAAKKTSRRKPAAKKRKPVAKKKPAAKKRKPAARKKPVAKKKRPAPRKRKPASAAKARKKGSARKKPASRRS